MSAQQGLKGCAHRPNPNSPPMLNSGSRHTAEDDFPMYFFPFYALLSMKNTTFANNEQKFQKKETN